jgi:Cytochrome c oxidase assembly protein CtaG/Cox11
MLKNRMKPFLVSIAALIALTWSGELRGAEQGGNTQEPTTVTRAYLRAVYARDFAEAYRYVSAEDRRAKSLDQYLRQQSPFNGFALEVARTLAAIVEIETIETPVAANQMSLTARYKAPDPEKLSGLLYQWNAYQLNSLPSDQRKQILGAIEQKKRAGSLQMLEGEEKLSLVKEGNEWRIFLNWAAGVTIPFQTIVAEADPIDVTLSRKQAVIQPGELFEIVLRIKNRSPKPVIARIGHIVEPNELADYLEFVQCGFLLPVKLPPGIEQEYSGTYLVRGNLPQGVRQLNLKFDFRLIQDK